MSSSWFVGDLDITTVVGQHPSCRSLNQNREARICLGIR